MNGGIVVDNTATAKATNILKKISEILFLVLFFDIIGVVYFFGDWRVMLDQSLFNF